MSIRRWVEIGIVSVACTAGAFGCSAPTSRVERGIETMQRESTPGKLGAHGDAAAALGDMTRAEQYYMAALQAGGDKARLVRRLVAVCVVDGRYPVALEYAEHYLQDHPGDIDVRYVTATLRLATGDDKRAMDELALVAKARPQFGDVHYALAMIHRRRGDVMAADSSFRAYLTIAPEGAHAEVARENLMRTVP